MPTKDEEWVCGCFDDRNPEADKKVGDNEARVGKKYF
jgi:hypothetical protein